MLVHTWVRHTLIRNIDYDDIDYDEGYSMRDIDNSWLNDNMDYETDSDSNSDMDNYNYNYNYGASIGDKINRQTNRHNNSFLDRINKKSESLEAIERSTTVERKNDRDNRIDNFLDLYERIKALNSDQERNFEPHQRSSLVTDNWHDRKNSSLVSTNRFINITCRKDDEKNNLKTLETTCTERKDYSHVVWSSIESQENNNRKDDIIETIQKNPSIIIQKKKLNAIDGDKERRIERQQGNSILTNSKETLLKELEIEKDIMKENKERYNNSLEKVVNKVEKDDSSKKSNSKRINWWKAKINWKNCGLYPRQ